MAPEDTAYVDRLRQNLRDAARQRTALADALEFTLEALLEALSFEKVRDCDFDRTSELHIIADRAEAVLSRDGRRP